MPLTVWAFVRDEETREPRRIAVLPSPPRDELAGLEASRHDLWGSDLLDSLGCEILSRLDHQGELTVEGTELAVLESELRKVLADLRRVCAATEYRSDFVEHRARNILEAIRIARDHGGGVRIG